MSRAGTRGTLPLAFLGLTSGLLMLALLWNVWSALEQVSSAKQPRYEMGIDGSSHVGRPGSYWADGLERDRASEKKSEERPSHWPKLIGTVILVSVGLVILVTLVRRQ